MLFHSAPDRSAQVQSPSGAPVDGRKYRVPGYPGIQAGTRFRFSGFVVVAVLLLTVVSPARASAPEYEPEERASALARPALVQVDIRWSAFVRDPSAPDADPIGAAPVEMFLRCSGFFVNTGGRMVTAAGCLDPVGARPFLLDSVVGATPAITPAGRRELRARLEASAVLTGDRTGTPGGDYALSVQWDRAASRSGFGPGPDPTRLLEADLVGPVTSGVAVVQVHIPSGGGDRPVVEIGSAAEVRKSRPVVALGYPGGVAETDPAGGFPVDRWGAVVSTGGSERDAPYEMSAAAAGAMRGGPVVDMEGRVIGLSGSDAGDPEGTFSAIPLRAITNALRTTGTETGSGPLDGDYRAGLDHFYKGEVDAAIARFERIVDQPSRHDAAAFLARSRDLKELETQRGKGLPVLFVVVVIVAMGSAILVLRNRAKTTRPHPVNNSSRGNPEGGRVP